MQAMDIQEHARKLREEGKEYVVKDGDVMHFRFAN
jgi:ribosome-binding ATPase YchF (GTP1/OBG family)